MRFPILFLLILLTPLAAGADWDYSRSSIDTAEIMSGGPPKDGIPALLKPTFVPGKDADFLKPADRVLGVVIDGIARAYPTRILSWHELVNDRFGDTAVLVSW